VAARTGFFESINYASFHEDSASELRALQLQNTDRVLCLSGSGARPLDLLIASPAEVVAIDWSPAQSMLLELKIAVIRHLSYEEGLAFLGLLPAKNREQIYEKLKQELSPEAIAFWDRRRRNIRRGVYFEGRWERFLRIASWTLRTTRGKLIKQVLNSSNIEEQSDLWATRWNSAGWRFALRVLTSRFVVKYLLREPGLQYINRDVSPSTYLQNRFQQAASEFLLRESPWVCALAHGRITATGPLPLHLQEENFSILQDRIDSIRVVTASLFEYLQQQKDSGGEPFQAFSLSDFSSYATEQEFTDIWEAMLSCADAGARICERRFLVEYRLPATVESEVTVDHALGEQLSREDRSVVYSFLVARKNETATPLDSE